MRVCVCVCEAGGGGGATEHLLFPLCGSQFTGDAYTGLRWKLTLLYVKQTGSGPIVITSKLINHFSDSRHSTVQPFSLGKSLHHSLKIPYRRNSPLSPFSCLLILIYLFASPYHSLSHSLSLNHSLTHSLTHSLSLPPSPPPLSLRLMVHAASDDLASTELAVPHRHSCTPIVAPASLSVVYFFI